MINGKEQQPSSDRFDIISSKSTRLIIVDPENVQRKIEQPPESHLVLLHKMDDDMPSPAKFGHIDYSTDPETDAFWLSGRIQFTAPENEKDTEQWQDIILQNIEGELTTLGVQVSQKPEHRSTLYAELTEGYIVKISIEENTNACGVVLEVEESPSKDINATSDDKNSVSAPRIMLVRNFLMLWNTTLSSITSLYGDGNHQGTKDITIHLPDRIGLPQSSLTSSIPEAERIDASEIRPLRFDDIGGASEAKAFLQRMALAYRNQDIAKQYGIKPSSFLLHGPAGTGKTSLVHAFAHEIDAALKEYSSSDIIDKYAGNSGKAIHQIFEEAKKSTDPLVLFFDEFDSITPKGREGTSERQQVKNILKKQLVDLHNYPHIVVAAATNCDMGDFDEALVRAGRLRPLYVAVPTEEERIDVWGCVLWRQINELDSIPDYATTTRRNTLHIPDQFSLYSSEVNPQELAGHSDGLTGADMVAILQQIQENKFLRRIEQNEVSTITQADILDAIRHYQKP